MNYPAMSLPPMPNVPHAPFETYIQIITPTGKQKKKKKKTLQLASGTQTFASQLLNFPFYNYIHHLLAPSTVHLPQIREQHPERRKK
jgi:hypothetical protein